MMKEICAWFNTKMSKTQFADETRAGVTLTLLVMVAGSLVVGMVYGMVWVSPKVETVVVCHSLVPSGYHYSNVDTETQACYFSNGTRVMKTSYLYDAFEKKYVLYKVET